MRLLGLQCPPQILLLGRPYDLKLNEPDGQRWLGNMNHQWPNSTENPEKHLRKMADANDRRKQQQPPERLDALISDPVAHVRRISLLTASVDANILCRDEDD